MTRLFTSVVVLTVGLTACGKKEEAAAPVEKAAPQKVSIEAEATPPPPAETPAQPATTPGGNAPEAAPAPPPQDVPVVAPRKVDQIEGWLHAYQAGDAAGKADIVKKIRAANLTAGEKAFMEATRQRYGYAPIPLN
jgi:hypothetical protein